MLVVETGVERGLFFPVQFLLNTGITKKIINNYIRDGEAKQMKKIMQNYATLARPLRLPFFFVKIVIWLILPKQY
jgi:hypothetical protein